MEVVLPAPLDAGHHDDEGLAVVGDFEGFFQRGEQLVQGFFEGAAKLAAVGESFEGDAAAHVFHDVFGGFDAPCRW